MKYRAVQQQPLFGTVIEDRSNPRLLPAPIQPELIARLAQLIKAVIDAIEREANDEQDHR